jgi:hypothetical protein
MSKDFGGLVDYHDTFIPEVLPLPNGERRSQRSAQKIAVQYKLPAVWIARRAFIDPVLAADILRKAQLVDRAPQGPGRPRKL